MIWFGLCVWLVTSGEWWISLFLVGEVGNFSPKANIPATTPVTIDVTTVQVDTTIDLPCFSPQSDLIKGKNKKIKLQEDNMLCYTRRCTHIYKCRWRLLASGVRIYLSSPPKLLTLSMASLGSWKIVVLHRCLSTSFVFNLWFVNFAFSHLKFNYSWLFRLEQRSLKEHWVTLWNWQQRMLVSTEALSARR